MSNKPKFVIPKPCHKQWDTMKTIDKSKDKICQDCQEKVYDLRQMAQPEIVSWSQKNKKNVCVIAERNQLSFDRSNKKSIFNWRKIGIASVFIGTSLFQTNVYAQESSKADSYVIEQSDLTSEKFVIEGVVKVKGIITWKRIEEYSITVFSNDIKVIEILVDKKGKFKIELDKSNFTDKMTINIHAAGYKSIEVYEIEVKDTMMKVYLDEGHWVTGRFF